MAGAGPQTGTADARPILRHRLSTARRPHSGGLFDKPDIEPVGVMIVANLAANLSRVGLLWSGDGADN